MSASGVLNIDDYTDSKIYYFKTLKYKNKSNLICIKIIGVLYFECCGFSVTRTRHFLSMN